MSRWTGQELKALRVLLLLLVGGLAGQLWLRVAHEAQPQPTDHASEMETAPVVMELED